MKRTVRSGGLGFRLGRRQGNPRTPQLDLATKRGQTPRPQRLAGEAINLHRLAGAQGKE